MYPIIPPGVQQDAKLASLNTLLFFAKEICSGGGGGRIKCSLAAICRPQQVEAGAGAAVLVRLENTTTGTFDGQFWRLRFTVRVPQRRGSYYTHRHRVCWGVVTTPQHTLICVG